MIYSYGVTQIGDYHIKHNTVCQDAHCIKKINDHYAIGAVADGLGSEMYSDIASKIAAEKSVEYCAETINETDDELDILKKIKNSFRISLDEINSTAKEQGHDLDQYDTTLALAAFIDGNLYYGNSGDSGIVVLNQDGTYEGITVQQRDENGCLFPLFFGEEKWEFGTKRNIASVFLATDGMYETLFPYLLRGEENSIYIALARYMMSEECLDFQHVSERDVQNRMENFISNIPADQVSDDKTVLVMVDTAKEVGRMPEEYYQAPDWEMLKKKRDEEYKRLAYPHMYNDENV